MDAARAVLSKALQLRTKDDVSIVLARVLPQEEWAAQEPASDLVSGPIYGEA